MTGEKTKPAPVQVACPAEVCLTTVFADGFLHGLSQWVETGDGDFTVANIHEHNNYNGVGDLVAHAADCDVGCTIRRSNIDISKASSATLRFRRFVDSAIGPNDDFGPYVCAGEYCTYLAKWYGNFGDDNIWHDESFDLEPFVGAPAFDLRFIAQSSSSNRIFQIDDVEVLIDAPVCGNQACDRTESCASCATDCGLCAPNTTIYSDNFATIRRWTELGYGNWSLSGLGLNSNGYPPAAASPVARAVSCVTDCILESPTIDLSLAGSASLSVLRFVDYNIGPGEYLKIEATAGDGSWQTIATWTDGQGDNRRWTAENIDISAYAGSSEFQVRFVVKSNSTNDIILIDNFAIIVSPHTAGQPDRDGDRLPDAVETHTQIYLSPNDTGTDPDNADTDGDFIFDGDEVLATSTGLDLAAMGVNPLRKDILIEFDWFEDAIGCSPHTHRPTAWAIDRFTQVFANAPVENPDGSHGITVISDYGQGGLFTGGSTVADPDGAVIGDIANFEFDAIKAAQFSPARARYFHYVLMPHSFGAPGNLGAADINGDDIVVGAGCEGSGILVAHTVMHELGHNLGLRHGGFEDRNQKPNYNSVMNYRFALTGVDTDCDSVNDFILDYSHGTRIDLYEPALIEADGVCSLQPVAIDWNLNGSIDSSPVVFDLDGADGTQSPLLQDFDDWAAINFDGIARPEGATVFGPRRIEVCRDPRLP